MVSAHYWGFPFGVGPAIVAVAALLSPVGDLEVIFELSFLPLLALMGVRFGDRQVGKLGSSGDRNDGGSDLPARACVTIPSICRMDGVERRS